MDTDPPFFPEEKNDKENNYLNEKSLNKSPKSLLNKIIQLLLIFSFLVLSLTLIFFVNQSEENKKTAKEWQTIAKEWQKSTKKLEKEIKGSRKTLKSLEKRQGELSEEKALIEDQRSLYRKASFDLLEISSLQEVCSQQMTLLVKKTAEKRWGWVQVNSESIFSVCNNASKKFNQLTKRLSK